MRISSVVVVVALALSAGCGAEPPLRPSALPAGVWTPTSTQIAPSVATAFVFDGRSEAAARSVANHPAQAADAGPPSLDQPVVSAESRTVFVSWHRGFGDAPLYWLLEYTTPTGGGGSFTFPTDTTSVTGSLPLDGTYTVRICAFNPGGCAWSVTRTFQLLSRIPGPPRNLRGSASGTTISLSWDPSDPAAGGAPTTYVVLFEGAYYPVGLITSVSATVNPGTYLVAVLARNGAGDSAAVTVTVTVSAPPPPPPSGPLSIVYWKGSMQYVYSGGRYHTTGSFDLTLNREVSGSYRFELSAYPFFSARRTFTNTRELHFDYTKSSDGCPDMHGTIPLFLYDAAEQIVASIMTRYTGTGCAFNDGQAGEAIEWRGSGSSSAEPPM